MELTVVTGNMQAPIYGGSNRFTSRGQLLHQLNPDIILLQETIPEMRDAIRKVLGPEWKVYPTGGVAVMWNSKLFKHATPIGIMYGKSFYNRAICVPLTHIESGKVIHATSAHPRSLKYSSTMTKEMKRSDVKKAFALGKSKLAVVGGDFNTGEVFEIHKPYGFVQATKKQDTYDVSGNQYLDGIFVSGLTPKLEKKINPGALSDHSWLLAVLGL